MDGAGPLPEGQDGFARQVLTLGGRTGPAECVHGHHHVMKPIGVADVGAGELGELVDGSGEEIAGRRHDGADPAVFGKCEVGHASPPTTVWLVNRRPDRQANARHPYGRLTCVVRILTTGRRGSELRLVLEGELHQGVAALQSELLRDGGAQVLDGAVVEPERLRNLLAGLRFGDQAKDVTLAFVQRRQRRGPGLDPGAA